MCYHTVANGKRKQNPGLAKFGIALEWGSRGRWFESSNSDQKRTRHICVLCVFLFVLDSNPSKCKQSGGLLLKPVQTLVSTIILRSKMQIESSNSSKTTHS